MSQGRRAARVLSGGFVIAGALVAPATLAAAEPVGPTGPSVSIACIDRTVALLSVAEAGLGLSSVVPLTPPLFQEPAPSTNSAVAVLTLTNPTDAPFDVLVVRDVGAPVPFAASPGVTVSTAFDVADGGTSVFRVTDPAGAELALVASTADCSTPPGWCDAERAPGAPVAADHADICPLPGDEVLGIPEASADEPAPTGKVVDGAPEVLAAQLYQSEPESVLTPPDAIVMPSATPPPTAAPAQVAEEVAEERAAAPATEEPQLALSGSRSSTLAQLAALLLGIGVAVTGVGRRRADAELDDRALDAMSRIVAVSTRP